jgi:DNA mismatch repair protein MLH3
MQCYESRQDYNHNLIYEGGDSGYSFTREDLARATVLGQVDKKFVVCLMNDFGTSDSSSCLTSPSTSLVLIDQHAADERIRVERYLKDLCVGFIGHGTLEGGVKEVILDQTLPLLLTRHEALMLKRSSDIQDAFARWGVRFDLLDTIEDGMFAEEEGGGYVQVIVKTVPDVISNKVSLYCRF